MTQFSNPKNDLTHPAFLKSLQALPDFSKSSYLIGLAAWQRGLTVEYFGTQAAAGVRHIFMPPHVDRPDLFRISDGARSHFFNRTFGDATPIAAAALSADKEACKECFRRAGIKTPAGLVWTGNTPSELQDFLSQTTAKSFVLKPVKGSRAKNTFIGVRSDQVAPLLAKVAKTAMLVEERILGPEFRVYVVGNKVIAAFIKIGTFVIGNGLDTIASLIAQKNARRSANLAIADCQIDVAESERYLARFGARISDVPPLNSRVVLTTDRDTRAGGDTMTVTDKLHPAIVRAALGACAVIGLPNAAVDLMADTSGVYVLEVNARAGIHKHSYPTEGTGTANLVAEAIVDWYFPTADGLPARRHTQFFDSAPLLAAFAKDGHAAYYKPPTSAS